MVFIVNPAEAQAIQEDEAQLMAAIVQASRSIPGLLYISQTTVTQTSEQLRIQMGRRVVYGQLADGPFRNELNSNSLRVIFDALQKPVTEGADSKLYQGKIPTIEIRNGETILFREERNGTITINEIQLQTEQEAVIEQPPPTQTPVAVQEKPETIAAAHIARWLLNPLGDELPLYEAVTIQGYRIAGEGDRITVTKGSNLVLVEQNGEVAADQMDQEDWEVFQSLQQRNDHQQIEEMPAHQQFVLPDLPIIEQQSQPATVDVPLIEETPPAIATLERETAKLPDSETKEFLQATTQNWKQQLQEGLKAKIQQGFNWLASRPEVLRNQGLAHAAIELFNRGYERTGERSYQVGEYIINFKGGSLYTLRDNRGELMRFQTTKSIIPGMGGQQVQVLAVSDRLNDFQRTELLTMQRDRSVIPQGDMDVEANYAARTRRLEQTVRGFLRNHAKATVWDKEGGMFKLEMGAEGYLCITDKQNGHGVVFQRQNGEVFSKLGAKDFAHFDRLATRMQQVEQQQPLQQVQPPSHFKMWLPQNSPALELE
jgi:hypothetical protein